MAKKREASHADADTKPRKKVTRHRRKSWEFEIVLCEDSKPNELHPLFGLTAEQREQSRVAALGTILADIAIRKVKEPNNAAADPSSKPT